MPTLILKSGLYFIGIAAILIASAIALIGIELTGQFFSAIINILFEAGPMTDLGEPNDDSELRFYSVFFIAYGVVMVRTANKLQKRLYRVPWLLGLFFMGGVARGLSYIFVGPPHKLFLILMWIELIAPLILWTAYLQFKRKL